MWDIVKGFFESLYGRFNGFLQTTLDIDGKVLALYDQFIVPLPELIKVVGMVFLGIVIVLGVISFVKKNAETIHCTGSNTRNRFLCHTIKRLRLAN